MRIIEKISAFVILISLILKFNLIPGGNALMLWATLILTCVYYPFGFLFFNQIRLRNIFKKESYKDVSAFKIVTAIITGLGLSIICVGSLFKLLTFTGASEMLLVGLSVTAIVLLVSLTQIYLNRKFIFTRASIIGGVGIILFLTSELSIIKIQYRNHPDYIHAYENYLNDPKNEELLRKKEMEYYKIILTEDEFKLYEKSTLK